MREFLRVFSRKNLLILVMLCLINVGIFYFCADAGKDITPIEDELNVYLADYPRFIQRTMGQAENMAKLPMYKTGYAKERLEKITEDYRKLAGVKALYGDNRGIMLFVNYRVADVLLIIFLFIVVMDFFAERKKGLVYVVRSTFLGRGVLFVQRVLILLAATVLATVVFYGSSLLCASMTLGVNDLQRSIQSLPEFMKCSYHITIWQYILLSAVLKAMGCFLACMLVYVIQGIFSKTVAYGIIGIAALVEAGAAILITPISSWNILKYLNLASVIMADSYFYDCIYLKIFGKAVAATDMVIILWAVLLAICTLAGFLIHGKMYVNNKRTGEKLADLLMRIKEKFSIQHTLLGWEAYKLYIRQGAVLILAGLFLLQISLSFKYEYYYPVNAMERLYYIKYHGIIDEEKMQNAEHELELLKGAEQHFRDVMGEAQEKVPFNPMRYYGAQGLLEDNLAMQKGFLPVYDTIAGGYKFTQETKKEVWIVEPFAYDLLINRDVQTRNRAAFLEIMTILAALAGVYSFENQNHMKQSIRTSYRGRFMTASMKPVLVILFCAITAIMLQGVQLYHINKTIGFNDLDIVVQSIPFLRHIPFTMSIGTYLILMMAVRAIIAAVLGLGVAYISHKSADRFTAMGISIFVVMLWFALTEFVPGLSIFTPVGILGWTL